MRDYPYVCGADIHSVANKAFVRFETAKSKDIVVALDKSNIPFSAKYNDTKIVLTYDGNYKDSVDEITAKIMSEILMSYFVRSGKRSRTIICFFFLRWLMC